jgi:hypothetical protein
MAQNVSVRKALINGLYPRIAGLNTSQSPAHPGSITLVIEPGWFRYDLPFREYLDHLAEINTVVAGVVQIRGTVHNLAIFAQSPEKVKISRC